MIDAKPKELVLDSGTYSNIGEFQAYMTAKWERDRQVSYANWHDMAWDYRTEFQFWEPLVGTKEATRFGYSKTRLWSARLRPFTGGFGEVHEEH